MKCPNCHHVSEAALLKCGACGEVYDRDALETLQHVEYLVAWLEERAGVLGPGTHERLCGEALGQLSAVRDALGVRIRPTPLPRAPEAVAAQLALVMAALEQTMNWRKAEALSETSATRLRRYLGAYAEDLKTDLAGRRAEIQPPSDLEVADFALESLTLWAQDVPLRSADVALLHDHLSERQSALLREGAEELALVSAAFEEIKRWHEASAISTDRAYDLRQYLSQQAEDLKGALAGRLVEVEPPTDSELLDFASESLPLWAEDIPLPPDQVASLREHLGKRRTALLGRSRQRLALVEAVSVQVVGWAWETGVNTFTLQRYLKQQAQDLEAELGGRRAKVVPPTDVQVLNYALRMLPLWGQELRIGSADLKALGNYLSERRQALLAPSTPTPAPATVPAPVPAPAPVARPPRPAITFDWGRWWDRAWGLVVSGALLRGLLYLGAFMIVVAAAVLAVRYWDSFTPIVQLAFISAVPLAFYANGFVLRTWFKAPVAGGVFTGIGALLVAVDFAAVYQFGDLSGSVDGIVYWLGASIFCTLIYALTAWRLPTEFFGYVTLVGVSSTVLALTGVLRLPLEWDIAVMTALAAVMVESSGRMARAPDRWGELALAVWRLPYLLLPLAQALVLFVPGEASLGQMGTFLFAALGYGLLARDARSGARWTVILAHAAAWSSVLAAGFALQSAGLSWEWYATGAAILAPAYLLSERWVTDKLPPDVIPRQAFGIALYWAGFGLLVLAVGGGIAALVLDHPWSAVLALTLAALVLAWCAYLYRRPLFVLLASGLFIVPFSLTTHYWLDQLDAPQSGVWLMAAWTGLGLVYLGLAASLRGVERYAARLNLWAHILVLCACDGLVTNYIQAPDAWIAGPTLAALGGVILVYVVSAVIHDSGRHPALSNYLTWLPERVASAVFLWPVGIAVPIWMALAWHWVGLDRPWLGVALAGSGLVYVGLGELLARRKAAYRPPPHAYAYALAAAGILVTLDEAWPLLTALLLAVGVLSALAVAYRRVWETALAALLFIWPFQLALQLSPLAPHTYALAYALLASLGYIPLGIILDRAGRKFALPQYVIGYGMSACALVASLYLRDVPWVGVAVPLVLTGSQVFSVYHFRVPWFAWAAAVVFPIGFGQALALLTVSRDYLPVAWVGLALAYVLIERALHQRAPDKGRTWTQAFRWPLGAGAVVLCALGLALTARETWLAFSGEPVEGYFPVLLAQTLAAGLTVLAAWLYRSRWPLYPQPWLVFVPVTLFFIGYGQRLFGGALTSSQFGVVWSLLGLVHLLVAVPLDQVPFDKTRGKSPRYAHGLYLGAYALGTFAILWTLADEGALFWTLGLGLAAAIGSALLVHAKWHRSWDDLITLILGTKPSPQRAVVRSTFLWLAAWSFPVWCVLLLRQLDVVDRYQWLGLALPPLLYLGLARWLRRYERGYAWSLQGAAQFYTALGLIISAPLTGRLLTGYLDGRYHLPSDTPDASAFIALQALGVAFYAAWAWLFRNGRRFFAHLSAWLSPFPYTLGWMIYGPELTSAQFAWAWIGWAALLLGVGFALDRRPVRYAHGPYLVGYLLGGFALLWSAQALTVGLYTLAAAILLAGASQLVVHFGRHRSFDDLINFIQPLRDPDAAVGRVARTVFLFFAVYAFPVWLTLLLTYHGVPLAWRGVALALVAPLYVACGLAARRVRPTYTWPLYSAGYALTAIGAMVTFEDERLAIYTLGLDAVVYAVSAYIFQQSFWLYLSNSLAPIIALLTLHYNQALSPAWVSGIFMGLAFLYFGVGGWFDRRVRKAETDMGVAPWALSFHLPGYLLSAVALAVASGERSLALVIFPAGVGLYMLSAWTFRESVFLYPAVWLAAVPYYLVMTLTPLASGWYGLGWLPLIAGCIALGHRVFHKASLGIRDLRSFVVALTHPAMPFYLMAYGLSGSMVVMSWGDPLTLACAFSAGAAVYLASAVLFRRPAWLYPALGAAHLALAVYLSTHFSGSDVHYVAVPFLGMTWAMALIGAGVNRRLSAAGHPAGTGDWAFMRHLDRLSWASPFFQFAAFDLIFWQSFALGGMDTSTVLGIGHAALLALFATLWVDTPLAYVTLGYLVVGLGAALRWAGLPLADALAWVGGTGFGLYLLAWVADAARSGTDGRSKRASLAVWPRPLTHAAIALAGLAVVGTLPAVAMRTTAAAAALAFGGALCVTIAYRERHYYLGYAGMALLELAWILTLITQEVRQPQLYAIPAGLYFAGIGILERRRERRPFAVYIQCFGLVVMLLTSFIQSLNSAGGFPYFLLLLVEALLVIWCGAAQRVKIPFFIGLGASALNVVGQVTVLLLATRRSAPDQGSSLTPWLIILGVGLLITFLAVVVERQRARIIARTQEWREVLEAWE